MEQFRQTIVLISHYCDLESLSTMLRLMLIMHKSVYTRPAQTGCPRQRYVSRGDIRNYNNIY